MNTYSRTTTTPPVETGPGSDHHLASLWTNAGMVETDDSRAALSGIEARHQAIIGDPAALGLFGFATGTLIAGLVLSGEWPLGVLTAVIPPLLWFAGVGQFICGLFGLVRGSTFAATAFGSFGMGNIIVATFLWMREAGIITATSDASTMLGIALFCLAYIALMLTVAAARTNGAYMATVAALVPGYALSAVPDVGGSAVVGHIGGWFLVAAAVLAFYAAGAVVVNSQWTREVLPLFKLR